MMLYDLTGLCCPLPVLKAQQRLRRLKSGEKLEILADDPLALLDLSHMCAQQGYGYHHFLQGDVLHFIIEKA